jgi:putative flippase GtrA
VLFALVGVSNTAIDVGLFFLLTEKAHVPALLANAASYGVGALNSFALNQRLTFRGRALGHGPLAQVAAFALVKLACLGVSTCALGMALLFLGNLPAKAASIAVTFVFAYTLTDRLVFRAATADRGPRRVAPSTTL